VAEKESITNNIEKGLKNLYDVNSLDKSTIRSFGFTNCRFSESESGAQ
jgi:hypothetical protein